MVSAKDLIPGSSPGINLTTADIPRGKELPRDLIEQGTPSGNIPLLNIPYERLVMIVMELQAKVSKCETDIANLLERINDNGSWR